MYVGGFTSGSSVTLQNDNPCTGPWQEFQLAQLLKRLVGPARPRVQRLTRGGREQSTVDAASIAPSDPRHRMVEARTYDGIRFVPCRLCVSLTARSRRARVRLPSIVPREITTASSRAASTASEPLRRATPPRRRAGATPSARGADPS